MNETLQPAVAGPGELAVRPLMERLQDEIDQRRNDGAIGIAALLDELVR